MQNTTNYNLKKPESNEFVNVDDINSNMDIIDEQLKNIDDYKVTKIIGKGLSTNDYTTAEKEKLATLSNYDDSGLRQEISTKADKTYTDTHRTYTLTHTKLGTVHTLTDLPTVQGIFQCQFIAQFDYNEGDTFTGYTAKPTGEETTLPDKAFVKGDIVSITVDTVGKKLGFKLGGSGVNQTLPPQIRSFAVTSGNAQNKLSWLLPTDTTAYEGLTIVRKVGSAPTKVSDGTKISLSKTAISYTDTGLTNDTKYYYRAFPFNAKKQYQTELTGAVVSGTPKAEIPVSNLPVGTLVKDVNTKYYDEPIVWKIADKNHSGYPANSVTLIADKILTLKCFDGTEPSNSNADRKSYGNNRYIYANMRRWLNSNAGAGAWYEAQHSADAPPSYDAQAGFLNTFSSDFINALLKTTLKVARNTVTDGGGSETLTDKLFLASNTEVGLANENGIVEGAKLALFTDNASRVATPTAECVSNGGSGTVVGSGWRWWLRTPYASLSGFAHDVYSDGNLSSSHANNGIIGVRPLCNIKNDTLVLPQPDSDGAYIIQF